jgi:hypothetical protein
VGHLSLRKPLRPVPPLQALKWISKLEAKNGLKILNSGDPGFQRSLEAAVRCANVSDCRRRDCRLDWTLSLRSNAKKSFDEMALQQSVMFGLMVSFFGFFWPLSFLFSRNGVPVVLQGVDDTLDSSIEALLLKQIYTDQGRPMLNLGVWPQPWTCQRKQARRCVL